MKKFYYHSHGWIHAVEVDILESMTLRDQLDAAERAVAESERLTGASQEDAAGRARVIRIFWEDMERERGTDKPQEGDGEKN